MYIISRADLPPGLQAAQAAHAAFEFSVQHPEVMRTWNKNSTYLILLSVSSYDELLDVLDIIVDSGAPHAVMIEPDLGHEHTAVAVGPHPVNAQFSHLPLQGKELAMVT